MLTSYSPSKSNLLHRNRSWSGFFCYCYCRLSEVHFMPKSTVNISTMIFVLFFYFSLILCLFILLFLYYQFIIFLFYVIFMIWSSSCFVFLLQSFALPSLLVLFALWIDSIKILTNILVLLLHHVSICEVGYFLLLHVLKTSRPDCLEAVQSSRRKTGQVLIFMQVYHAA